MKTANKEYKNELTKYFQNYRTIFENGLRNTSKTDPKKFWSILNRIDRSSEKEKISIDNLHEYFKDLNNYNDIDDESEFDITYDNDFINSSIARLPENRRSVGPDRQKCNRTDDFKIYIGPNVR